MIKLLDLLKRLSEILINLKKLITKVEVVEPIKITIKPIENSMETNQEKLIKVAIDALDTDVTPQDNIPDEVACSEVVSTLINRVFPDFPILGSTADLFQRLKIDKRFKAVLTPQRGTIIVTPRTTEKTGHTGIYIADDRIASNNSLGKLKGKFTGNYSWNGWVNEFVVKKGLRVILFDIV